MDNSTTSGISALEQGPVYPVTEVYAAPIAAEHTYEQYSIAASVQQMFKEAEQSAELWQGDTFWEQEYPGDTAAYRMFMKEVYAELKNSTNVQDLRRASEAGQEITVHMVEAVFRSYERAIQAAFHRLRDQLHPAQLDQLKSASRSQLDWSYRDLLLEHVAHADAAPTRFSPEDFFLILNPKARKVQYMDKREILTTLRQSLSQGSRDQLKRDVAIIRQYEPIEAGQELLTDSDLNEFTPYIT